MRKRVGRTMTVVMLGLLPLLAAPAAGQVLCGDCDGNMMLNVLDALVAAQHAAGLITLVGTQFVACDVDVSQVVNVLDALQIAQAAAGLPVVLTCNQAPTCAVTAPAGGSSHTGDVTVDFDTGDPDGDPLDLSFDYSTDAGLSFAACTAAAGSPLANPAAATAAAAGQRFLWDALADVPAASRPATQVLVRVTADDGLSVASCASATFELILQSVCAGPLTWTQYTPPVSPSARYYPAGTWDTTRSRFIAYAGSGGGHELWFFDPAAGTWTQGNSCLGGPTSHHTAVYIPRDDCLISFDGEQAGDFWKCDFSVDPNGVWSQPAVGGTIAGHWGTMVWDEPNSRIVWAGGQSTADGLWELPIAPGGVPGSWNPLAVTGGSWGTRWGWRGDYDPVGQRMVCFYGNPAGNPQKIVAIDIPASGPYAVQTWDPPACPHDRWYPQVWFDGTNGDLYIYSSSYSSAPIDWVTRVDLDLPSPIYENMTMGMTNPPRRYGAAIGHDRDSRTVYMFGGNGTAGDPQRDDTWKFCY